MTLPNFFVIGAMKAGTTSLGRYLDQHPDVFISQTTYPLFFAEDLLEPWQRDGRPDLTLDDYRAEFEGAGSTPAVGEVAPEYLYSTEAPRRIHDAVPDARLIVVLRDPAERAFSSYLHVVRDGTESIDDFADALDAEPDRTARGFGPLWHYRAAGRYDEQLQRWLDVFDRDQMWIGLYDDYRVDAVGFVREVFRFLGVDGSVAADTTLHFNVSSVPRSRKLFSVLTTESRTRRVAKQLVPERWREPMRVKLMNHAMTRPKLAPEIRRMLVDEYRDDIANVEKLLDSDLSAWTK